MPKVSAPFNTRRIVLFMMLASFLASIYMLTYSGRIESSDTLGLFDATSSLVQFGDAFLDSSAWYTYPPPSTSGQYPLAWLNAEPMQVILAAPLFWTAYQLPGVGLVHAVWLFNVLVCAAAGGVFFWYVLALGYSDLTATVGTLLLGLCTIIWPYSKTFFREPLALLMLLLAGLFLERWRSGGYRSLALLVGAIVFLIGGYLTKEAVIFGAPALLVIAAPRFHLPESAQKIIKWLLIAAVISFILFAVITIFASQIDLNPLYTQIARLLRRRVTVVEHFHTAIHSYLFSLGGSVWGTSPILLLAIPGIWALYHRKSYRYIAVIVLMLLSFSFGYAFLRGQHWFGGLSWPPRFLVPAIPFLALGILPVIERVVKSPVRILFAVSLMLIGYSIWVQLSGILLPWEAYNQILPAEAGGLGEWGDGLNVVSNLRWVMLPPLWTQRPLDLVWVRVNAPLWPVMFAVLTVAWAFSLYRLLRNAGSQQRVMFRLSLVAPVIFLVAAWLGLRTIYRDPYYLGDREALHRFIPTIAGVGQPGDVMFLDNTHYSPFFMNYGKFMYPRVITLSDQPGERPSPEQAPGVTSDNPVDLLLPITPPLIFNTAASREHVWLLADSSAWLPWRVRPVERFMASHYYPVQELSTDPPDPELRLIEYGTTGAPDPYSFRGPDHLTDLVYGEGIELRGFTLPEGTQYQPGDIMPISLYWLAQSNVDQNYTVAWFLVKTDISRVIQGMDTQPYWGFAPTSTWIPNVPEWDNRALRLPLDLTPGRYELWVRLYQSDAPEILLPVSGSDVREENTGVLPILIDMVQ